MLSMEADREFKHVCKFCSKRFQCGRSLGGHMRSHMINDITSQSDGTKITKKKLPSLITNNNEPKSTTNNNTSNNEAIGYGLRENPKRTWRSLADKFSTGDTSGFSNKFCKECGKVFQSWKSLFGHMKSHSLQKERVESLEIEEEEQQDSWNSKLVMDSQSDNETAAAAAAAASYRKRRSKRRTRYMRIATDSSSFSFASSSASEIEHEQEEVAMCLIMLSMDKGALNSVVESSVLSSKQQVVASISDDASETVKLEIAKLEPVDFKDNIAKKSEFSASGTDNKVVENSVIESDKNLIKETEGDHTSKGNSSKRKSCFAIDTEFDSEKSSKFECTTCNKIFHSYQALGGHKASHKRIKACFASTTDNNQNSIESKQSPDQKPEPGNKIMNKSVNKEAAAASVSDVMATDGDNKAKKSKGHECPICFKVFQSGQALGGHKRSHLVNGTSTEIKTTQQNIAIQEPNPVIRDLLDLNLPAPPDEDESNGVLGFNNPWWVASSHEPDALVSLISN